MKILLWYVYSKNVKYTAKGKVVECTIVVLKQLISFSKPSVLKVSLFRERRVPLTAMKVESNY